MEAARNSDSEANQPLYLFVPSWETILQRYIWPWLWSKDSPGSFPRTRAGLGLVVTEPAFRQRSWPRFFVLRFVYAVCGPVRAFLFSVFEFGCNVPCRHTFWTL